MGPIFKDHIAQERTDVIEKGLARAQFFANKLIALIQKPKNGMKQKRQQVERQEKTG
jgi:hypothetical protein